MFWLTLALLALASILTAGGEFLVEATCSPNCCQYNRTQGTSHRHLNKSSAQICFPRVKKGQMDEENPAFARHTRPADYKIYFPNTILSKHILHNMTYRWSKTKLSFVLAKFGSPKAGHRVFWRVAKIWRSARIWQFLCVTRIPH